MRFTEILNSYDQDRLRSAFEACDGYNRTTLMRWLEGTIPQRGDFIRRLASELDDPDLYDAWEEAKRGGAAGSVSGLVKSFERLSAADRDAAFHAIRERYVTDEKPRRQDVTYDVTVTDPPTTCDDVLLLRVEYSWTGDLPADAWCQWVTDEMRLSQAYAEPTCLWREIVDLDRNDLPRLFEQLADEQVLAYNEAGARDPKPIEHRATVDDDGIARFDNAAIDLAQITLSMSYPIPRGTPLFIIKLGEYAVPGPARATLTLDSRIAGRPRAFSFLAPGRRREWVVHQLRPNRLVTSLGTAATVLGEGDGFVLSWTVGDPATATTSLDRRPTEREPAAE